ncbi:efflux RND transporter periplasmic adaptor subunit [Indioceanicola profundi]|uniref:efflux RND transporter periplasmic adaptor subunit n=1 Tax=Indioceanicola profundi TaxID=2220096 RepID=UPI000E6AA495|nr:efflux RND transporter periplasmic adaptor subunit [Indioceanicola profundi]
MKRLLAAAAAVIAISGAAYGWQGWSAGSTPKLDIQTAAVERGTVRKVVATSGRIGAVTTVEVGSQLSGQILELLADYNTQVTEGQTIARIDPRTYQTRLIEAEAAVAVANASVKLQTATLQRNKATLEKARADFERAESLRARGNVSDASYDATKTALDVARADVAVAEAQLANAEATLKQRDAALDSARIDLDRTYIRAPIDGTVIDRSVDLGQTVAASLQAPVLFVIAGDLTRMQIEAQVDEADIGQVQEGNPVNFTVDAFPDRNFTGVVEQIRLQPTETSSVVTYTVIISAENPGRRLLPGMTANVEIVSGERSDVLTVANEALRFQPRGTALALVPEEHKAAATGTAGAAAGGNPMLDRLAQELNLTDVQKTEAGQAMRALFERRRAAAEAGGPAPDPQAIRQEMAQALEPILTAEQMAKFREMRPPQRPADGGRAATIWTRGNDGNLIPARIRVGLSDDMATEVLGGLEEGARVVTRVRVPAGGAE